MPDANKAGDAVDLIPEARRIGQRYALDYVIKNKPAAPLQDAVVLEGRMFGFPIKYARAFETSFPLNQPPRNARLGKLVETSPFFSSERSTAWWRAAKGEISGNYQKEHLVKNSLPLPYVHHLVRAWLDATAESESVRDYSDYDEEMDVKRAQEDNAQLTTFGEEEDN